MFMFELDNDLVSMTELVLVVNCWLGINFYQFLCLVLVDNVPMAGVRFNIMKSNFINEKAHNSLKLSKSLGNPIIEFNNHIKLKQLISL